MIDFADRGDGNAARTSGTGSFGWVRDLFSSDDDTSGSDVDGFQVEWQQHAFAKRVAANFGDDGGPSVLHPPLFQGYHRRRENGRLSHKSFWRDGTFRTASAHWTAST